MATTPNYGWVMPDPADLVKDLPADFETFGDAVDADLAGLLGGTTGQVLIKDSASDHDFSWQTANFDSYVVLASGSLPTGAATLTLSSISQAYLDLVLVIRGFQPATGGSRLTCQPQAGSSFWVVSGLSVAGGGSTDTYLDLSGPTENTATSSHAVLRIMDYATTTGRSVGQVNFGASSNTSGQNRGFYGYFQTATDIDQIKIDCTGGGNFAAGTYVLYGVK